MGLSVCRFFAHFSSFSTVSINPSHIMMCNRASMWCALAALTSLEDLEMWNCFASDWKSSTNWEPLSRLKRLRGMRFEAAKVRSCRITHHIETSHV